MSGALVLTIAGVFLLAQVTKGQALQRLGLL
jgi:hypothetical protein